MISFNWNLQNHFQSNAEHCDNEHIRVALKKISTFQIEEAAVFSAP